MYWYFWVIVVAVETVAGAAILQRWLPRAGVGDRPRAAVRSPDVVNLSPSEVYGEFEFWFASIKVAAIIVFISIGAAYVFGFGHTGSAVANSRRVAASCRSARCRYSRPFRR